MQTYVEAVQDAFNRYADFEGASSRTQYWMYFLFNLLMQFIAGNLDFYLLAPMLGLQVATIALALALVVPGMAVSVRRLHDIGKSGWLLLAAFVPILGVVYLVYLFCQPGRSAEPSLA